MTWRKYFFTMAAVACCIHLSKAQNLLINGSFEGSFNTAITNSCNYFFALNGCYATHGTPQIGTSGAADQNQYAHMWFYNNCNCGEGVALSMNTSTVYRRQYDLCFWYRTANDPGTVNFLLTTNAPTSSFASCGDPIPAFAPSQVLTPATPLAAAANWTYYSITFNADASGYNTLVFYPQNANNAVFQLDIDGVVLTTCDPSLEMDLINYPVPAGEFERMSYIRAGSHINGSTTTASVTASPTINTTFRAGNFVLLEDNFLANPNSGIYFLAEIGPCQGICTGGGVARFADAQSTIQPDFPEAENRKAEVYPNPFSSAFGVRNLSINDVLEIYNAQGQLLWKTIAVSEQMTIEPNLKSSGIYILKVTGKSGNYSIQQLVME